MVLEVSKRSSISPTWWELKRNASHSNKLVVPAVWPSGLLLHFLQLIMQPSPRNGEKNIEDAWTFRRQFNIHLFLFICIFQTVIGLNMYLNKCYTSYSYKNYYKYKKNIKKTHRPFDMQFNINLFFQLLLAQTYILDIIYIYIYIYYIFKYIVRYIRHSF